jgi:hypothetical protein
MMSCLWFATLFTALKPVRKGQSLAKSALMDNAALTIQG